MTNKQLRLSTAAILATSVVVTAIPTVPVEAATYKDVPKTANFFDAVSNLSERGLITGYADKTFKPYAKITRGQIAKILTRMLDLETTKKLTFSDVPNTHSFYSVANAVVAADLMSVDKNGKFNTKDYLTRNEYAEILTKAFQLKSTNSSLPFNDVNAKYKTYIQAVYDQGIMKGNSATTFNGGGYVNRSQIALTLYRTILMQEGKTETVSPTKPTTPSQPEAPAMETKTFSVYELTSSKIITYDDEEIKIPEELKTLIRKANEDVLVDAEIEAEFTNGVWTSTKSISIFVSGTSTIVKTLEGYGGNYPFTIIANGENIRLRNMTVNDVKAGDSADTQLTLENVTVKNKLIVDEGLSYDYRLRLLNSDVPYITINQDYVTVESDKTIPQLFLTENVYDININSSVKHLQLVRSGAVSIEGTGTIESIVVPLQTDLYINTRGLVKTLRVDDPYAWIQIGENASIGTVVLPANTDYEELLSYPGHIQENVAKIQYPNSNTNILSSLIEKPSKEEIAYQNALKNVVKAYSSSLANKVMTIRTDFNDIPASLKEEEIWFDQVFSLAGTVPNVTSIPLKVRKGGLEVFNDEVTISELLAGVSMESLTGETLTLADFTSNGNLTYHLEFDTDQELKIRSTVTVNEEDKLTTEQTINAGMNAKIVAAAQNAFKEYTGSATVNTLSTEIKLNNVDTLAKDVPVEQYIRLTDTISDTALNVTIKKNGVSAGTFSIPVGTLRNGLYISSLVAGLKETLGSLTGSSETKYTFEIESSKELTFENKLFINGIQKGTTKTLVINPDTNKLITAAFNNYTISAADKTITATIKLNAVDAAIKDLPIDQYIKLQTSTFTDSTVKMTVKRGTETLLANELVDVNKLKSGVTLNSLLTAANQQKVSHLQASGDQTYMISFDTEKELTVNTYFLMNGEQKGSTYTVKINDTAISTALGKMTFTNNVTKLSDNSVNVKISATPKAETAIKDLGVDVKVKMNPLSSQPEKVKFTVVYDGKSTDIEAMTSELENGFNVFDKIDIKNVKVSDLESDKQFTITATSPIKGTLQAQMTVAGTEKGNSASQPIVNLPAVEGTYAPVTVVTTIDTTTVSAFELSASTNALKVKTNYNNLTSLAGKYLDARLTLTSSNLANNAKYTFDIYYNDVLQQSFKQISIENLKKGIFLSEVLGVKPVQITSQSNTNEEWRFVVHDLKGEKLPVKVELFSLTEDDISKIETTNVLGKLAESTATLNASATASIITPVTIASLPLITASHNELPFAYRLNDEAKSYTANVDFWK